MPIFIVCVVGNGLKTLFSNQIDFRSKLNYTNMMYLKDKLIQINFIQLDLLMFEPTTTMAETKFGP